MQPAERWPLRRGLSIVVDRFRTSDFGLGEQPDLADGQHVGDATLAFFGATCSLGPESIDADTAALGQAELGHFGSAVFFPDACAEEDRGDVFEVLADTLTKLWARSKRVTDLPDVVFRSSGALVRCPSTVILMLIAFPPLVRGGSCRSGCGGPRDPAEQRCKEAEEESCEGAAGRGGRDTINGFSAELRRLGVTQKHSRPNHPTTCGKVERFHQTLKKWLTAQTRQPQTLADLQALCDTFIAYYNNSRPLIEPAHPVRPPRVRLAVETATPLAPWLYLLLYL
jgi:Integrase core domain